MPARSKLARLVARADPAPAGSVLVVEDSRAIRQLLCSYLEELGGFTIEACATRAEAEALLADDPERFFCAALDLNLSDAPNGEVVDAVRAHGVPVIVLTGSADAALRERIMAKHVVDYVLKQNAHEIEHVAYLVGRLRENRQTKILVVDDSRSFRQYLVKLLERYFFQTFEATDGKEALAVIEEHPDTTLVITDVNMPHMNGYELISTLRLRYRREDLAIIGVSDARHHEVSARLLKLGANDFLSKPFVVEEFYCRVTQNTNMIAYVRQVRDSAIRDFLTGVYNRRHLFEVATTLYGNARRGRICLMTALLDADHFKAINDTHGHAAGDRVLKAVAQCIQRELRESDVVARYGGEEFVALAVLREAADAPIVCERVRAAIEACPVMVDDTRIPFTLSIGATTTLGDDFEAMLARADEGVYRAKMGGRNRVEIL
ncbi:MAG: diguanylate cyclase [Gammaproteobacteria bacterium]